MNIEYLSCMVDSGNEATARNDDQNQCNIIIYIKKLFHQTYRNEGKSKTIEA